MGPLLIDDQPREPDRERRRRRRRVGLALAVASLGLEAALLRRRGYGLGGRVLVRCSEGHLFTTIWIPGVSVKAARLGWRRLQRCPVGHHFSLVTPVAEAGLSPEDARAARRCRDVPLP